jgi:uncharacterized membrane protein
MVEGSPGFEHSFLKRAWHEDPSFQVDSVVRKGQNDQGQTTYYVQADPARTAALGSGFPLTREALFAYDALVFANADFDLLSRAQLEAAADFVGERGGGLLVLGSRALASQALAGSPVEPVLPLELTDRRGGLARAAATGPVDRLRVAATPEGLRHPVMRLAGTASETATRWAGLPALAGAALVGGPRPGASVLALTQTSTGATVPLVAVQRYGSGRAMIFGGEASWHWKMMRPATDRSYDAFWRQALRWLAAESADPVSVSAPATVPAGGAVPVQAIVRDEAFQPVPDAEVKVALHAPDGSSRELPASRDVAAQGRFVASWPANEPGVHRVTIEARRGPAVLGSADAYVLVGGIDPEFTDPRLNEPALTRLATGTGGAYLRASRAEQAGSLLRARRDAGAPRAFRDVWHNGWSLALVITLLSTEWVLRRRWGLR